MRQGRVRRSSPAAVQRLAGRDIGPATAQRLAEGNISPAVAQRLATQRNMDGDNPEAMNQSDIGPDNCAEV